jgi:hypothetical protein
MTKSPNKFNSHTYRENLTTSYGNNMISVGGKIHIKNYKIWRFHGNLYSRKFLRIWYLLLDYFVVIIASDLCMVCWNVEIEYLLAWYDLSF